MPTELEDILLRTKGQNENWLQTITPCDLFAEFVLPDFETLRLPYLKSMFGRIVGGKCFYLGDLKNTLNLMLQKLSGNFGLLSAGKKLGEKNYLFIYLLTYKPHGNHKSKV